MKRDRLRRLRNIGIAAHIDAGKTTLTERVLYFTGKSHRIGETHDGNSQMDTMKQEIEKGITISSAATHTKWKRNSEEFHLNIIDTPGHVDFMIEVERSLRVLDGLVALFDAVAGVEPQTETIWTQAERYQIPILAMVNKMDRIGSDYFGVVQQIRDRFGVDAIPLQVPIGSEEGFEGVIDLVEYKAVYWNADGEILDKTEIPESLVDEVNKWRSNMIETIEIYLEEYADSPSDESINISPELIRRALRTATINREIVPVVMGAAYKNKGVQTLLDAICDYLPSPVDLQDVEGEDLKTGETITRKPSVEAPFTALAFKIALDEQNRQLCFFRVYSGSLKVGESILNPRTGKKERIARLYQVHSNKREEIKIVEAGDIAATVGLKSVITGDTLCAMDQPVILENLFIPKPVISMAIEAKISKDLDKLGLALNKLQLEDPSFKVKLDEATGQTIILGMGELHLNIIIDKLKEDFKLDVNVGSPKVAYQEVFSKTIQHRYRLSNQTGGGGLFAEIDVIVGPADNEYLESDDFLQDDKRVQFVSKIVGGSIPKEFIPAVEKGFTKMLGNGVLAGYPVQHLKVELLDGKTHVKDSNPLAFELCAKEAFRAIAMKMQPRLVEPMMSVEIMTPLDFLGNILGGINRRRGIILSQNMIAQQAQLEVEVPLSEMFGYVNHLRSVSQGRATYSMKFKRYALVSNQIEAKVLAEV